MRISQTTSLSKPSGDNQVPEGTFGYFRSRNRHRIYSLIIREFKRAGISQADLARRLGKTPDVVCRLLRAPSNLTLDTLSDVLFACSGAEVRCGIEYPLDSAEHVSERQEWLPRTQTTASFVKTYLKLKPSGQEAGIQIRTSPSSAKVHLEAA